MDDRLVSMSGMVDKELEEEEELLLLLGISRSCLHTGISLPGCGILN